MTTAIAILAILGWAVAIVQTFRLAVRVGRVGERL